MGGYFDNTGNNNSNSNIAIATSDPNTLQNIITNTYNTSPKTYDPFEEYEEDDTCLYDDGTGVKLYRSLAITSGDFVPSDWEEVGKNVIQKPGVNWELLDAGNSITAGGCYGNGLFVMPNASGAGQRIKTSPDGRRWTYQDTSSIPNNNWYDIAYGNGVYVAVADTGTDRVMTSPNGKNWTLQTASTSVTGSKGWRRIAYGNGVFIAVSNTTGTNGVMVSTDKGVTWALKTAPTGTWGDICFNDDIFWAVAYDGAKMIKSTDNGQTWTSVTVPAWDGLLGVAYGNGTLYAVSHNNNAGSGFRILTSTDKGATFEERAAPVNATWLDVVYGNGVAVIVSQSGPILYSLNNGITWEVWDDFIDWEMAKCVYGNGIFVAHTLSGAKVAVSGDVMNPDLPNDIEIPSFKLGPKTYNAINPYAEGDTCLYDDGSGLKLYRASTTTTGSFNTSSWALVGQSIEAHKMGAKTYNSARTYAVDDTCLFDDGNGFKLYRATATTTGTFSLASWQEVSYVNPKKVFRDFSDFILSITGTPYTAIALNSATVGSDTSVSGRIGLLRLSTNALANAVAGIQTTINMLTTGDGAIVLEQAMRLSALSDATDTYVYRFGFGSSNIGADHVNGIYFEYDHAASANWRICTSRSSTRTKTNTTTSVAINTWFTLKIMVNAAGTSTSFYINNILVGTIITNLPTPGTFMGVVANITKSLGTLNRFVNIDYVSLIKEFTTTRV